MYFEPLPSNYDRGVVVFDIKTGEIYSIQENFLTAPFDIDYSPDGTRLIATGDLGYGFRRWRVDTGESVHLYDQRSDAALRLAWSSDGQRIVSTHQNGTVCFWTVATNQCDGFIQAHNSWATGLAWSPDGTRLATGGGIIRIWNTQTGLLDTSFGLSDTSVYSKLAWPNPDLLISLEAGYEEEMPTIVRFWDLSTGKILMEFQGASGLLWQ
jgi:WD40 repeat protein